MEEVGIKNCQSHFIWRITKQKPIEIQIKIRKWNWIGHIFPKKSRGNRENRIRLEFSGV
jgi:hypothetical protein